MHLKRIHSGPLDSQLHGNVEVQSAVVQLQGLPDTVKTTRKTLGMAQRIKATENIQKS
jgi:hypothetical protein